MLIHLCIVRGCFHTMAVEWLQERPYAYKAKNIYYLAFYRESLLTHNLDDQTEG